MDEINLCSLLGQAAYKNLYHQAIAIIHIILLTQYSYVCCYKVHCNLLNTTGIYGCMELLAAVPAAWLSYM